MPLTRKEFVGTAPATTLASGITDVATALTLTSGTGYPTGGTYPFVLTLERGTANEEKVLCSARAGAAVTITTRGYDGTTGVAHSPGAVVEHTIDAVVMTELVARAYDADGTFLEVSGQTIRIKDLGVTTAKLNDGAVTPAKLAADAVETAKIDDGAVTAAKLAADAVETAKIDDLAVTTGKINDLAVTEGKLADDAVTTDKIADAQVTTAKLASGNLSSMATGSYTGDGTTNRTIALAFTPTFVYLVNETEGLVFFSAISSSGTYGAKIDSNPGPTNTNALRPKPTTNGFIVSGTTDDETNDSGATFRYIAMGV